MQFPIIAQKIIKLKNEDLAFRDQLIADGQLGQGYHPKMEEIHIRNAKELEKILDEIGYPTISKVGKEANQSAWLIIQHAISLPSFMKRCRDLLGIAVEHKEASSIHLAYLTDRIASFEDQLQLYGTAFDWDENGIMNPKPYDDLYKVNQRRADLGLHSLEEQTQLMRRQAKQEQERPRSDKVKRKLEYDKWRKSVGWII